MFDAVYHTVLDSPGPAPGAARDRPQAGKGSQARPGGLLATMDAKTFREQAAGKTAASRASPARPHAGHFGAGKPRTPVSGGRGQRALFRLRRPLPGRAAMPTPRPAPCGQAPASVTGQAPAPAPAEAAAAPAAAEHAGRRRPAAEPGLPLPEQPEVRPRAGRCPARHSGERQPPEELPGQQALDAGRRPPGASWGRCCAPTSSARTGTRACGSSTSTPPTSGCNFDRLHGRGRSPPMRQTLLVPLAAELGREDASAAAGEPAAAGAAGLCLRGLRRRHRAGAGGPGGHGRRPTLTATLEELAEELRTGRTPASGGRPCCTPWPARPPSRAAGLSDPAELQVLVEQVQSGEVRYCPHGRPGGGEAEQVRAGESCSSGPEASEARPADGRKSGVCQDPTSKASLTLPRSGWTGRPASTTFHTRRKRRRADAPAGPAGEARGDHSDRRSERHEAFDRGLLHQPAGEGLPHPRSCWRPFRRPSAGTHPETEMETVDSPDAAGPEAL